MRAWICYDLRTLDNSKSSARLAHEAIDQLAWADDKPFEALDVVDEAHMADMIELLMHDLSQFIGRCVVTSRL